MKVKIYTPQEANQLLPEVQQRLRALRDRHESILKKQVQIDLAEILGEDAAGHLSESAERSVAGELDQLNQSIEEFNRGLEEFHQLGCELKDLDQGLVDFYFMRDGELAYLCWKEGDSHISHWHTLEGGYKSRQPL